MFFRSPASVLSRPPRCSPTTPACWSA